MKTNSQTREGQRLFLYKNRDQKDLNNWKPIPLITVITKF